jgi:hypothetical protein
MSGFTIERDLIERAIEALRYQAHNEAGMSQMPDLISKEDTQEWADAERLKRLLERIATPYLHIVGAK